MDTYFDIYGDPWGVSGRKNGAAASGSRKSGRKETVYMDSAYRKYHRYAPDNFKVAEIRFIHPDTVWKKRRQVLMKRNSKYL